MVTRDEWGEVINSEETYKAIAEEVNGGGRCLIGWSDGAGTHYDILFVTLPIHLGGQIQRGIDEDTDLFVSVMSKGSFGFEINDIWKSPDYVAEKLRMSRDISTEKLAELINGIIGHICILSN